MFFLLLPLRALSGKRKVKKNGEQRSEKNWNVLSLEIRAQIEACDRSGVDTMNC